MTAVTVPSPFSEKTMRSAAWLTGCTAEQKKPPQASESPAENATAAADASAMNGGVRRRFMLVSSTFVLDAPSKRGCVGTARHTRAGARQDEQLVCQVGTDCSNLPSCVSFRARRSCCSPSCRPAVVVRLLAVTLGRPKARRRPAPASRTTARLATVARSSRCRKSIGAWRRPLAVSARCTRSWAA